MTVEPAPAKRRYRWAWLIVPAIILAVGAYYLTPLYKAVDWLTLDVPALNRQIDGHMRSVHPDVPYACLYTVNCEQPEARLDLRTSLTPTDMERIRHDIWRRKFEEGYCTGRTSNFAIGHAGRSGDYPPGDCYVFGGGFGRAVGFAQGCGFGDIRAIPCTRDLAYWTREQGIVAGR